MLVVLSDTHGTDDHRLTDAVREAVHAADLVVHAGDFSTEAVLDAFQAVASDVRGVYGNTDAAAVRGRLPPATTLDYEGVRIAVTHTRDGGHAGLTMFGREKGADLVVFGHSHRPTVDAEGDVALLNPGSHADPRGNRQSFAVLEPTETGLNGELRTVDGEVFDRFSVEP
jgi:putative phosphoesterase